MNLTGIHDAISRVDDNDNFTDPAQMVGFSLNPIDWFGGDDDSGGGGFGISIDDILKPIKRMFSGVEAKMDTYGDMISELTSKIDKIDDSILGSIIEGFNSVNSSVSGIVDNITSSIGEYSSELAEDYHNMWTSIQNINPGELWLKYKKYVYIGIGIIITIALWPEISSIVLFLLKTLFFAKSTK